jgi:hypothetical protein
MDVSDEFVVAAAEVLHEVDAMMIICAIRSVRNPRNGRSRHLSRADCRSLCAPRQT